MGLLENSSATGNNGSATGPVGGAPMSPVRAFLVLLAVLVTAGVILWVTTRPERSKPIRVESAQPRSDNAATKEPEPTEATRPTKAEAKNLFKDLRARAYEAIENRDMRLLRLVYTKDGPLLPRVQRQVRSLLKDNVVAQSRVRLLGLSVPIQTPDEVKIRSKSRFFPCFIDDAGNNVTVDRTVFEEVAVWTLRKEGSTWQIHDHVQKSYKRVDGENASCP